MAVQKYRKFSCLFLTQKKFELVLFAAKASELWPLVEINKRNPDKEEGYQRALSPSRTRQIADYIAKGNTIPNSILVSFDGAKVDKKRNTIRIPRRSNAGWIIDGQHRLAGAHEAKAEIELPIVAFLDLPIQEQIRQFVVINREAKGVPTSLYYDLLKELPSAKSPAEMAKEKAAALANELKTDEESPFCARIVVVTSPKRGELSLTNFVRKVSPMVQAPNGKFCEYTHYEQIRILNNYYKGLKNVFPKHFEIWNSIFFQTIGFGAMMNALPTVFDLSVKMHQGFRVSDVSKILSSVDYFDFASWRTTGTGSQAETQAGRDLAVELRKSLDSDRGDGTRIKL